MQKIYICFSPTDQPENFIADMSRLKELVEKKYTVLDFSRGIPPKDAFKHDISQIKACDLCLAVCSHPSTGVGFEIATALNDRKPVLAVAPKGLKVSNTLLGITSSLFSLMEYQSLEEIADAVEKKLAGII